MPKAALDRLETEHDELVGALQWFIDYGRTDEALRLANALYRFWITKQRFEEGAIWFERALASPGGDDRLRGTATINAGFMPFWMGQDDQAAELFGRGLEIARATRRRADDLAGARRAIEGGAPLAMSPRAVDSPGRRSTSARPPMTRPAARTRSTCSGSVPRSPATCRRLATG